MLVLSRLFHDCYLNSDVMCHVTKYCNVIGLHCTVQWDTAYIHTLPVHFLVEMSLVVETKYTNM